MCGPYNRYLWSNFVKITRKAHAFQTWPKTVGRAPCLHACSKDWTQESNGVYFLPELNELGGTLFLFFFSAELNELGVLENDNDGARHL
jgi:hypothetical protein